MNESHPNDLGVVFQRLGIPEAVKRSYENLGLTRLYDWQRDCLFTTNVLRGENLVYCAPTSGGKTLVAELVLLKTVISLRKKAIFVLPYVSLVQEKEKHLKRVVTIYNRGLPPQDRIKVRGCHGDKGLSRSLREQVVVCTIEKANSVLNLLISRGRASDLGALILDETHALGSTLNGYLLELLVTKVKQLNVLRILPALSNSGIVNGTVNMRPIHIQTIALSATMGNVEALARWMEARLYVTNYRPIPLAEHVKAGNELLRVERGGTTGSNSGLEVQMTVERIIHGINEKDKDGTGMLCQEGLRKGQQVLVFCPTKIGCSQTAKLLCDMLGQADHRAFGPKAVPQAVAEEERRIFVSKLKDELFSVNGLGAAVNGGETVGNGGEDSPLLHCLSRGIAFHHSGLSSIERDAVEQAFRTGIISIIAATTTLAAGVNLPAGRVLILSLSVGMTPLSVVQYRQMCGRAGRAGQTSYGESFLIVKGFEKEKARQLVSQGMPNIESQMSPGMDGGSAFLKAVVEAVGLGLCLDKISLRLFLQSTLLFQQVKETGKESEAIALNGVLEVSLRYLVEARIVSLSLEPVPTTNNTATANASSGTIEKLSVTKLGKAMVATGLDPDEAIVVFESLSLSQQGLYLESHLHLLYLVSPIDHNLIPDYKKLLQRHDIAAKAKRKGLYDMFQLIGLDPVSLSTWIMRPPSRQDLTLCANTVHLSGIARFFSLSHSGVDQNTMIPAAPPVRIHELKALCVAKRLWAAMALQALVEGVAADHVAKEYSCTLLDLESLQRGARVMAHKIERFAKEMNWQTVERLVRDFKPNLDIAIPKELKELMKVPRMPRKVASVFVDNNVSTPAELVTMSVEQLVLMLQLSMGFELQV